MNDNTTSPTHAECGGLGKYDCHFDEYASDLSMDLGLGEGDVQAPCGWFAAVTLDPLFPREEPMIRHYGTRWLIAREFNDGQFAVETFDTEAFRDDRLESLREAWDEWEGGVL